MKNIFILGDSYSTFKDCIPEGFSCYYTPSRSDGADVLDVTDTWWHKLVSETGANIIENNSWSGSTISYMGRDGDCSRSSSFIYRFQSFVENNPEACEKIDTVFLFGATNDSWIDVPLGCGDPTAKIERMDLYSALPAIIYLVKMIRESLPAARLICLINTGLKPEIKECFINACREYSATAIELYDIDKINGHPTKLGMTQIKNQILANI